MKFAVLALLATSVSAADPAGFVKGAADSACVVKAGTAMKDGDASAKSAPTDTTLDAFAAACAVSCAAKKDFKGADAKKPGAFGCNSFTVNLAKKECLINGPGDDIVMEAKVTAKSGTFCYLRQP